MHHLIAYAKRYNHFANPDYPDLQALLTATDKELSLITPSDTLYKDAAASIQASDANLDTFTQAFHGRLSVADGDVGPATLALIKTPRCGCPDFPDPNAAMGEGGWPSCDPEHPGVHSIRIHLDTSKANSHWKNKLGVVMRAGKKISAEIGLHVRFLVDTGDDDVEESITWGSISGNTIGWNYLPKPDTCLQVLDGKIDNGYKANDKYSSILCIHEWLGHGIGLPHTRGGIMNPSIINTDLSWKNDPSYSRLKRYYGGKPLDTPETPDPTPPPETGVSFGPLSVTYGGKTYEYLVIPRPEV